MNLVGLMPVRNEDWVLGLSARVALMWCDRLIILLHACTDNSLEIATVLEGEFGDRVIIHWISDPAWDEMNHRQAMLGWAREAGATHIALVDCDEILTGNLLGSIRDNIEALSAGYMLTLPLYNLRGGLNRYHANGIWGNRITSVAFKDISTAAWKGDTHHAREPQGLRWQFTNMRGLKQGTGGVMHLWGASERRLIAKHSLYKMRDTLRWPEKKEKFEREYSWAIKGDPARSDYGTPKTWTYAEVPSPWWRPYDPSLLEYLESANARPPWQEAEVRRLVAEHGRERFEGLDLFGIV